MKAGTDIKFFTRHMFGVVVTGRVVKVSKDGTMVVVHGNGGGSRWKERVHVDNIVAD